MNDPEKQLEEALREFDKGMRVQEILETHPEYSHEVRNLLSLSAEIRGISHPAPNESLLVRTLAKVVGQESQKTFRPPMMIWKPTLAFATFIIVLLGVASVSVGSVPGTILYPIKIATERIRLTLAWTPEQKAEIRLELSDRRMNELLRQASENNTIDTELLSQTLAEAQTALDAATAIPDSQRAYWMERMHHFANYQKTVFANIAKDAPASDIAPLERAQQMCMRRMEQIHGMGGMRGPGMMHNRMMEDMMKKMMRPAP